MSRFRNLLREARRRGGLSQPKLAKKVDVDKSYISKLETGVFPPPSREVVLKLATALNIREKTRRWLEFLLAAGVASEEDMEGFELVEVEDDEAEEEEQGSGAAPYSAVHPASSVRSFSLNTIGGQIERLIAAAGLSEEEEEEVGAVLIEITKWRLAFMETQRKI